MQVDPFDRSRFGVGPPVCARLEGTARERKREAVWECSILFIIREIDRTTNSARRWRTTSERDDVSEGLDIAGDSPGIDHMRFVCQHSWPDEADSVAAPAVIHVRARRDVALVSH